MGDARARAPRRRCRRSWGPGTSGAAAPGRAAGAAARRGSRIPRPVTSSATEDHDQRDQLARAGLGEPRVLRGQRRRLGLEHADREPGDHRRAPGLEPADDRGRQRRDHGQGVGVGVSGLIGAMRMPAAAGDDGAQHPVEQRDPSGETPLTSAPVWVSATARVSSPKRVHRYTAVEHERQHEDGDGEVEAVGQHADVAPAPPFGREDRSRRSPARSPTRLTIERLDDDEHTERRHRCGPAAAPSAGAGTRRR